MQKFNFVILFVAVNAWLTFHPVAYGQSDPSNFDNVINAPPTLIGSGVRLSSSTQLNVLEGGSVGRNLRAGVSGSPPGNTEINVLGGTIDDVLSLGDGSTLNLVQGDVGSYVNVTNGAVLNLFGGNVGDSADAFSGSIVNVAGGNIGQGFEANDGSVVNISDGSIGAGFQALAGSRFNISGGYVDSLSAKFTSEGSISGGALGSTSINSGSVVDITGGFFVERFTSFSSEVTMAGSEFLLNGVSPANPSSVRLFQDDVLTGTLSDGSPFAFSPAFGDSVANLSLIEATVPDNDTTPLFITNESDVAPRGLRAGQALTLQGNGNLPEGFVAVNATMDINGGNVDRHLTLVNSVATISGGNVSHLFGAISGSDVTINGGSVGNGSTIVGSTVSLDGGSLGSFAEVRSGGILNVSAGQVGEDLDVQDGGTVNLAGGSIARDFEVRSGGEANISGGTVVSGLDVLDGGRASLAGGTISGSLISTGATSIDLSGGRVTSNLLVRSQGDATMSGGTVRFSRYESGSTATISGGQMGEIFSAFTGSDVTLAGGEFMLNGQPVTDSAPLTLVSNDVLSGTLEDGTAFILSRDNNDAVNGITLQTVSLPAVDTLPAIVNGSGDAPTSLRTGQSLTVESGGALGAQFAAVGSTLNVTGGEVGDGLELIDSDVIISDGTIGNRLRIYAGSDVTVSGGTIGFDARALSGSTVNLEGGQFSSFQAMGSSIVNVSGGSFARFDARSGSQIAISGGSMDSFRANEGSGVTLRGGEFLLNGDTPSDPANVDVLGADVLTGTLEDGSIFMLFGSISGNVSGLSLETTSVPAVDLTPIVINANSQASPQTVRSGQTLVLQEGGALPDSFKAASATLDIQGGQVGEDFTAVNSNVNISGGKIGDFFTIGNSDVSVSGGKIGEYFSARAGSNVLISGGNFNESKFVYDGSRIELLGTGFSLDGVAVDGLVLDEPLLIEDRAVRLNAVLADGTPISWDLQDVFDSSGGRDQFSAGAELLLTKVSEQLRIDVDAFPELFGLRTGGYEFNVAMDLDQDGQITVEDYQLNVTTLVETEFGLGTFLGDVNLDGHVDVLEDAFALIGGLGNENALRADGDLNADGVVDVLGDAFLLVADLGKSKAPAGSSSTSAVPEPGTGILLMLTMAIYGMRRHRILGPSSQFSRPAEY